MKTHHCLNCNAPHALFYWVGKSGKQVLSYVCNRIPKLDSYGNATTTTGRVECVEQVKGLDIPEQWGSGWAKKKQLEKEMQLPLMRNNKPNENTKTTE